MWIRFLGSASSAVFEIFLLGSLGFFLIRKKILNTEGLNILSKLVVEFTLPIMIFCQLTKNFSFQYYTDWWLFPLYSLLITILGISIAVLFLPFLRGFQYRLQFLSLVGFQNSGYLPLVLVSALLSKEKLDVMFIYIFLFLLGFNLIIWSLGVYLLNFSRKRGFELGSLFSPPVIATLVSLILVYLKLNTYIPDFVYKPLNRLGETTLPLAMLVVGGNLAEVEIRKFDRKAMLFLILAKLLIMPSIGLFFILRFRLPELLGLLLLIELAVPSATSLSLIVRHYHKEDLIISQGIFLGHIVSLITLPLFLSLYFAYLMVK